MRIGFWILILGFLALASGCGQQQETATTTTTATSTTTTTAVGGTTTTTSSTTSTTSGGGAALITLSGTLSAGTVYASGLSSAYDVTNLENYKVVAIDNDSQEIFYGNVNENNTFSFDVPPNKSLSLSIIDSASKSLGPVVMSGNSSSTSVIRGVNPAADTNLGNIRIDAAKRMAKPDTEPTAILDSTETALSTNGVPEGSEEGGKKFLTDVTTRSGSADQDRDGIDDPLDPDANNDRIRKGIAVSERSSAVVSNTVEAVLLTSNIWADHGTTNAAKDIILMRLHVYIAAGHENEITSAECIAVPAVIKNVSIIWYSGSLNDPLNYPAQNTLWKDVGYRLYKTTTAGQEEWTVLLIPKAIMSAGDIFTVRVHYTGGGYQDFFITTSYVLTDWSRILTYNGTTMPTNEGTKQNALNFTSPSLEVVFSKPLDEDGNVLSGLIYSIVMGTVESEPGVPLPVSTHSQGYRATNYPSAFTEGATAWTVSLHELVTFESGAYYYISPVAESAAGGQGSGEETWFKKQ